MPLCVSWSIFYNFCTSRNRKNQYLIAWWRHNSVIMHVTKVYFMQLVHKIKYVEFEDRPTNFYKNLWMWKCFCPKTDKRMSYKNWKHEHWTTFCESCEQPVPSNALWWLTSKCAVYSLYIVLVLQGSVETQLGWSGKFFNSFVEYAFQFPLVHKV